LCRDLVFTVAVVVVVIVVVAVVIAVIVAVVVVVLSRSTASDVAAAVVIELIGASSTVEVDLSSSVIIWFTLVAWPNPDGGNETWVFGDGME
jgi:hypothetical protein